MNLKEIGNKARELAKGSCRVCPTCDGRVCSGEVPGMGGCGSGVSFRNNISALAELNLNTRLIHNVRHPGLKCQALGFDLSFPLLVGPVGGLAFNLAGAMSEEGYQAAVCDGAARAGIIAGTPDAVPPEVMHIGLDCIKKHGGRAIPFIKPWEPADFEAKIEMCAQAGCRAVACDLDSIGLITLRQMGHPAYAKEKSELAAMIEMAHKRNMKIIIKGIMIPEDALAAQEAGADGIVVSNHGGRVLDQAPGAARVLPQIAAAVKGKMALLADGGIRSGVDILKMLALGAEAVFIGRPLTIAAIGGGAEGVELLINTYKAQLEQAMIMTGCPDVSKAGLQLLYGR